MPHLICYDISGNSLRMRLGKKIIAFGLDRINKSVYLGTISKSSLTQLESWIAAEISIKGNRLTDSCIVIRVSAEQIHDMRIYGFNDLDKKVLSGEKSTLIL
jgi:CRISPR-associated protein Cas2